MTPSCRLAGESGPSAAFLEGHVRFGMLPYRYLLSVVFVSFGAACFDDCRAYRPPHFEAFAEGSPAVDIVLHLEQEGWNAAALSFEDGSVFYLKDRGGELHRELVMEEARPGSATLSHLPSQEAVLALIGKSASRRAPPISALADSPLSKIEGEGELLVLRRRSPGLWRKRAVAARALAPAMVVDGEGTIHLAFLQPAGDGLFAVVYVRLEDSTIQREEVGRGAYLVRPHLALVDGRPRVTYVSGGDEPVVVQATASHRGVLAPSLELPAAAFGDQGTGPSALSWLGDEGGGWLALASPVKNHRFSLEDGRRVRLDERAKEVFSLLRIEGGKPAGLRVLGTTARQGPFSINLLDGNIDKGEVMSFASAIGASALLLLGPECAEEKDGGKGHRGPSRGRPSVLLVGPE